MILQQILLQIFIAFQEERTVAAAYHLLKGKKSGQTIQDVGIFRLHRYFGILPKLSRDKFDAIVLQLVNEQFIAVDGDGYYKMTQKGKAYGELPFHLMFESWYYRGNEHVFFARLSLIIQSLSYQQANIRSFIPIQRNEQIQHWVRQFLIAHRYKENHLQQPLYNEILQSLENLNVSAQQKEQLLYRLAGFEESGLTWQQLSSLYNMSELDIQLQYISTLQMWLEFLHEHRTDYSLLSSIMQDIRIETTLTSSAQQTLHLYKKGYSLEQISHMRRLKMSTIEDHIVEIAMHDKLFQLEHFVSAIDEQLIQKAITQYNTKKLRVLKEALPHVSYFQIRLVIAKGGATSGTY